MTDSHSPRPAVEVATAASPTPRILLIVLHGGRAWGRGGAHRGRLTYLRMVPLSRLWRADDDIAVWRLRYRHRGWNGEAADPLRDTQWVLRQAAAEYPTSAVVLIGHSMGGRAALLGASERVSAVCALAPWVEPSDPVDQLRGKNVQIAHGDRDYVTSAQESRDFTARARRAGAHASFIAMGGEGHTMLRSPRLWSELVSAFVDEQRDRAGS